MLSTNDGQTEPHLYNQACIYSVCTKLQANLLTLVRFVQIFI
jgi:hypothetical protein